MKNKNVRGFTLVELLIVIALIAILSVAVLATINPIEQTNKARDAKFKNDAAEVLSAYERYYASQNEYPWNVSGNGTTISTTVSGIFASTDPQFGVKGTGASGNSDGVLITTSELKGSFKGKEPFVTSVKTEDVMYVYHAGKSGSNYVCYTPKANANRQGTRGAELKCLDITGTTPELKDQVTTTGGCAIPATWTYTPSATNANMSCVPEGAIN